MEGPRAPNQDEYQDVLGFFTTQLRADRNWSMADEYPLAFNPANLANVRVIKDQGKWLSGAVVRSSLVKSPAGLLKVAGIGSVVTSPEYRNQGLSRAVLDSILATAKASACDVAILWTSLHDFYRKLGFELAGTEVSLRLEKPLEADASGLRIILSNQVAPESILRLYAQHTCGTLRSLEDVRKSLAIPNTRVYTAWDQNQHLQAYAVEGKGADLEAHIHEWGGAVSKLLPLFDHIAKDQGRPITVIAPQHSRNLIRQMERLGATCHEGVLGMIKILNPDLLFAKVRRYARNVGIEDFVLEQREGIAHFGFGEQIYKTDSESDMVRLIFGPARPQDLHNFDPVTSAALETFLPIPFWIWGWDSV